MFYSQWLQFLSANTQLNDQIKWKYIKFEIKNFTKRFSKTVAQNNKQEQIKSEKDFKLLKNNLKTIML